MAVLFGASTSFPNICDAVLTPFSEEDKTEEPRKRLLDPGAIIAVRNDDWEDPVGVNGLIVNRVNHCSALGLIERFLKLKW
jgi:hypothetical protein